MEVNWNISLQHINSFSVYINTACLGNLPQTAVLINSRGLDDFIKSICWALSGKCSMSLSSCHSVKGEQARSFSPFASAVTGEWRLYGTSMFIRRLSPFLKPVLKLYFYPHYNCSAVAASKLRAWLSMLGAAYWSCGAFTASVCFQWSGENNDTQTPEVTCLNMWVSSNS